MSPGCNAKCLVWPAWISPEGTPGIASCAGEPDHEGMHEGPMEPYGARVGWFEDDRRTFRGDLAYCSEQDPAGQRCVCPDGHRGPHAF